MTIDDVLNRTSIILDSDANQYYLNVLMPSSVGGRDMYDTAVNFQRPLRNDRLDSNNKGRPSKATKRDKSDSRDDMHQTGVLVSSGIRVQQKKANLIGTLRTAFEPQYL